MAADKYRLAEDQYFKLRGQFDTGRLTQDQFDEKLRELMLQDDHGRYWMLGADSGKWYLYDGAKWVQGEPYAAPPLPSIAPTAPPPVSAPAYAPSPAPAPAYIPPPASPPGRGFPLVPVLIGLALLVLAAAGFLVFQNRDRLFVAQRPAQITPILPPTITRAPSPTAPVLVPTNAPPTLAPLATAVPTAVPTPAPPAELPTQPAATDIPATVPPAVTIVVVTSEPTATFELPTLLPTATNLPPTLVPTNPPPTKTATKVPPTNTPVPNFPPNVYVTKITIEPGTPNRNQNATFTVTFLNTTGQNRSYNWLILTYRQGETKGFGESAAAPVTIPPGESTLSLIYTPVTGKGGGCESFYARAGWKISAFEKYQFPNTTGDPATVYYDVC